METRATGGHLRMSDMNMSVAGDLVAHRTSAITEVGLWIQRRIWVGTSSDQNATTSVMRMLFVSSRLLITEALSLDMYAMQGSSCVPQGS
jgi:hypothetical protein